MTYGCVPGRQRFCRRSASFDNLRFARYPLRISDCRGGSMSTTRMKPRVTSFAPQFLVDDLERSIAYYQKIGFTFGEPWDGFYAIGHLDGLELHLEEAPKNQ